MALSACTECGKEVSTHAERCPNCGNARANWFERLINVLVCTALFLISLGLVAFGFSKLTIATQGVGFIAIGLWFAICLRIVQAGMHKR